MIFEIQSWHIDLKASWNDIDSRDYDAPKRGI